MPQFVEHYGRAAITQGIAELVVSSIVAIACIMVIVWSLKEVKNMTKDERLFSSSYTRDVTFIIIAAIVFVIAAVSITGCVVGIVNAATTPDVMLVLQLLGK